MQQMKVYHAVYLVAHNIVLLRLSKRNKHLSSLINHSAIWEKKIYDQVINVLLTLGVQYWTFSGESYWPVGFG